MPPRTSTKRKSAAKDAGGTSKKARADSEADLEDFYLEKEDRVYTARIVNTILADPEGYELPDGDIDTKDAMISLARYARYLEDQLANASAPVEVLVAQPKKTPEQLQDAAEKLRKSAVSGIKKQMSWKPSCKTGSAKFAYDGVCPDPEVFGALMRLDGPVKWKMKKFAVDEFEKAIGRCVKDARYSTLYITSPHVNVRYSEGGEFKFSGSYGVWQPSK